MKKSSRAAVGVMLVLAVAATPWAWGQGRLDRSQPQVTTIQPDVSDPDVPAAALLTKEGKDLAVRLRNLRKSEAAMGGNHPSLEAVRDEIELIKQRLASYAGDGASGVELSEVATPKAIKELTDEQLREIVLQMAVKIEHLERRVSTLERRR